VGVHDPSSQNSYGGADPDCLLLRYCTESLSTRLSYVCNPLQSQPNTVEIVASATKYRPSDWTSFRFDAKFSQKQTVELTFSYLCASCLSDLLRILLADIFCLSGLVVIYGSFGNNVVDHKIYSVIIVIYITIIIYGIGTQYILMKS